eukprot:g6430.t1
MRYEAMVSEMEKERSLHHDEAQKEKNEWIKEKSRLIEEKKTISEKLSKLEENYKASLQEKNEIQQQHNKAIEDSRTSISENKERQEKLMQEDILLKGKTKKLEEKTKILEEELERTRKEKNKLEISLRKAESSKNGMEEKQQNLTNENHRLEKAIESIKEETEKMRASLSEKGSELENVLNSERNNWKAQEEKLQIKLKNVERNEKEKYDDLIKSIKAKLEKTVAERDKLLKDFREIQSKNTEKEVKDLDSKFLMITNAMKSSVDGRNVNEDNAKWRKETEKKIRKQLQEEFDHITKSALLQAQEARVKEVTEAQENGLFMLEQQHQSFIHEKEEIKANVRLKVQSEFESKLESSVSEREAAFKKVMEERNEKMEERIKQMQVEKEKIERELARMKNEKEREIMNEQKQGHEQQTLHKLVMYGTDTTDDKLSSTLSEDSKLAERRHETIENVIHSTLTKLGPPATRVTEMMEEKEELISLLSRYGLHDLIEILPSNVIHIIDLAMIKESDILNWIKTDFSYIELNNIMDRLRGMFADENFQRDLITELLYMLRKNLRKTKMALKEVQMVQTNVNVRKNKLKAHFRSHFQSVYNQLELLKNEMHDELQTIYAKKAQTLKNQEIELKKFIERGKEDVHFANVALQEATTGEMKQIGGTIIGRLHFLTRQCNEMQLFPEDGANFGMKVLENTLIEKRVNEICGSVVVTDPLSSRVEGSGKEIAVTGCESLFEVYCNDKNGKLMPQGARKSRDSVVAWLSVCSYTKEEKNMDSEEMEKDFSLQMEYHNYLLCKVFVKCEEGKFICTYTVGKDDGKRVENETVELNVLVNGEHVQGSPFPIKVVQSLTFTHVSDEKRNGIVQWFVKNVSDRTSYNRWRRETFEIAKGHVSSKVGTIEVQASSIYSGHVVAPLDVNLLDAVCTKDEQNSWWMIDFGKRKKIQPSAYTLWNGVAGYEHAMRNWRIQASNNLLEWDILREHENENTIETVPGSSATWQLSSEDKFYRYFIIYQSGPNASGQHHLVIGGIEIYGKLE